MYLSRTKQVTHVFALAVTVAIMYGIYCTNILDETLSETIDTIKYLFTPQINLYGNYNFPYSY